MSTALVRRLSPTLWLPPTVYRQHQLISLLLCETVEDEGWQVKLRNRILRYERRVILDLY